MKIRYYTIFVSLDAINIYTTKNVTLLTICMGGKEKKKIGGHKSRPYCIDVCG